MFFAGEMRGTFRFCCDSLVCCASPLAACPAASVAEVTASPERKSLRFMGPRFAGMDETQKDIRFFRIPSETRNPYLPQGVGIPGGKQQTVGTLNRFREDSDPSLSSGGQTYTAIFSAVF